MLLFILESFGTYEVVLIAFVALVIFGPRKLPTLGRTIGKYTAEFKKVSREFKDTWEREVDFAETQEKTAKNESSAIVARQTTASSTTDFTALNENDSLALPEIRAVSAADFPGNSIQPETKIAAESKVENTVPARKREWL